MTELGRAYGSALYALAEDEKQEDDVSFSARTQVCKLLADNPDYVRLIKDKAIAKTERLALLDRRLFRADSSVSAEFYEAALRAGGVRRNGLPAKRSISPVTMIKHGIVPAKVFSAEALSDDAACAAQGGA